MEIQNKKTKFALYAAGSIVLAIGLVTIVNLAIAGVRWIGEWINYGDWEIAAVTVPHVKTGGYAYNDHVPATVIESEIKSVAAEFKLDPVKMVALARCESQLDNLAKNDTSTALGVFQYLIKTWEETESFKNKRIARTDYKANIREAMIDISNGEIWRWKDCARKVGL